MFMNSQLFDHISDTNCGMRDYWENQRASLFEVAPLICPSFLMALIGSCVVAWQTQLTSGYQYILFVAVFSFSTSLMYFNINSRITFKRSWYKSVTAILSAVVALCGVAFGLGIIHHDWELCGNTVLALFAAPFILMKLVNQTEVSDP